MSDQYQTISDLSEGDYREKGSKFLAYAYPVSSVEDVKERLEDVRKMHPKSRHHCFAYRLGMDKNNFRANDDGEPSGSAGRPILGQIDSFGLTNVLVVVVRYFGGTKLGIPGLINAYKTSTKEAFDTANIIERTIEVNLSIQFGYEIMGDVMNSLKSTNINIQSQEFGDTANLKISIPKSEVTDTLLRFKAHFLKKSLEEAALIETIEHINIISI